MAILLKTRAATEITQFLANHPTPEQIVAFHPYAELAERAYELIHWFFSYFLRHNRLHRVFPSFFVSFGRL